MALRYLSGSRIEGLSGDTKPITAQDKSIFFETDTVKTFDYNLSTTTWTERTTDVTLGVNDYTASETISSPVYLVGNATFSTGTITISGSGELDIV
jgi:hypothetical protein